MNKTVVLGVNEQVPADAESIDSCTSSPDVDVATGEYVVPYTPGDGALEVKLIVCEAGTIVQLWDTVGAAYHVTSSPGWSASSWQVPRPVNVTAPVPDEYAQAPGVVDEESIEN